MGYKYSWSVAIGGEYICYIRKAKFQWTQFGISRPLVVADRHSSSSAAPYDDSDNETMMMVHVYRPG